MSSRAGESSVRAWSETSGVTPRRRPKLSSHQREVMGEAVENWSGKKPPPEEERRSAEKAEKRRPAVRLPGKKPQKTSAEAEAEALMADLQSPSETRRRGAKSALGWMTFGDESVYDSYSDSVAVAEEWEGVAEAAVDAELLEVLHELRLERYAASLARLGVESLADVGKRTPNALMTIGMAPGECHALFTELLLGQAQPVPRVRGEEFWSPNREPLLAPNTTARNPGPRARGRGAQSPQSPELEAEHEERASQSSSGWGGSPPRPSSPGLRHTRESLGRDDDSADPRMTKTGTWMDHRHVPAGDLLGLDGDRDTGGQRQHRARSKERDSRIIDRASYYRERGREYDPEGSRRTSGSPRGADLSRDERSGRGRDAELSRGARSQEGGREGGSLRAREWDELEREREWERERERAREREREMERERERVREREREAEWARERDSKRALEGLRDDETMAQHIAAMVRPPSLLARLSCLNPDVEIVGPIFGTEQDKSYLGTDEESTYSAESVATDSSVRRCTRAHHPRAGPRC